ncbi:hypothetical protein FNSP4_03220 [Fusobacterium nucleatum]|nr:hypothetical protein FNCP4_21130 [Fusobacterium nucleatum]BEO97065.1 hypothetical protein FNCP10_19200 [Fusobacterium nucleatum]BEP02588.1 hypothetical protein FNSP4_03220 [Fusobacterium nucleatum]BEP07081.1 hypothetical protein FNSP10_04550 [Fusobacterium nucleatum]
MINQLDGEKISPDIVDFKKTEGFRLPTEVEWEWFARGGQIAIDEGTFSYKYSGSDNVDEVAWYDKISNDETKNVGTKNPNQLGLLIVVVIFGNGALIKMKALKIITIEELKVDLGLVKLVGVLFYLVFIIILFTLPKK